MAVEPPLVEREPLERCLRAVVAAAILGRVGGSDIEPKHGVMPDACLQREGQRGLQSCVVVLLTCVSMSETNKRQNRQNRSCNHRRNGYSDQNQVGYRGMCDSKRVLGVYNPKKVRSRHKNKTVEVETEKPAGGNGLYEATG